MEAKEQNIRVASEVAISYSPTHYLVATGQSNKEEPCFGACKFCCPQVLKSQQREKAKQEFYAKVLKARRQH